MLRGLPPVVQLVKLMANPARATTSRIFISSSGVLRTRMVLVTRASRRRWCRGADCSRCWGGDRDLHPILPSIALTSNNRRPIAFGLLRTAGLALKSHIPFPVPPHLVASRTYNVRGILIGFGDMLAEMQLLAHAWGMFLDCLPTVNRSLRSHKNRVFCEGRGNGGGIVVIVCLSFSFKEIVKC
jgi:hypothetical protein